jgi:hypothetical protein
MSRDEDLQYYLEKTDKFNKGLHAATVKMPIEPQVTPVEKILDIPHTVWDNDQYGRIDDLIEYVRTANHVPRNAGIEVAFEEISRVFRMRFYWWEVVVVTERGTSLY